MAKPTTTKKEIAILNRLANFDQIQAMIKKVAVKSMSRLRKEALASKTNFMGSPNNTATGQTARSWNLIELLNGYVALNKRLTKNKKHNIIQLLNDGRKAVIPKKARLLYIPLTSSGELRSKSAKHGRDFILAKKAKAVKGRKFLEEEEKKATNDLRKALDDFIGKRINK